MICFPRGEWQLHWLIVNGERLPSLPRVRGWLPAEWLPDREMNEQKQTDWNVYISLSLWACPLTQRHTPPLHKNRWCKMRWGESEKPSWVFKELLSTAQGSLKRLGGKKGGNSDVPRPVKWVIFWEEHVLSRTSIKRLWNPHHNTGVLMGKLDPQSRICTVCACSHEPQYRVLLLGEKKKQSMPFRVSFSGSPCLQNTLSSAHNVRRFTSQVAIKCLCGAEVLDVRE